MIWSDYWGALSARQRIGLGIGAGAITALAVGLAVWLLRDPFVPLAADLSGEQLNGLVQELDRAKLSYRIEEAGNAVAVPQSLLGKARAALASGEYGLPPSVGLELFKETDFSSTDFAQKINYQRALQGELTRTIQTIAGVRSARVHVILGDGGLFKRNTVKSSAAVSVALHPRHELSPAQVRGIQRLVAASVPEIKIDDVVVLDESGRSLTRTTGDAEGDLSSAQLELKRQADQYLESKLTRLLEELAPQGTASLSVDTTLDFKQLKVTTEEPLAAGVASVSERPAGVLVKERQSERRRPTAALLQASNYEGDASEVAAEPESTDWEHEYKVGHRMEQTLSAPGSIQRVSVALALKGAPPGLTASAVEQLVAHAVGINRSRGDSVAVVLLPSETASAAQPLQAGIGSAPLDRAAEAAAPKPQSPQAKLPFIPARSLLLLVALAGLLAAGTWWLQHRAAVRRRQMSAAAEMKDVDAMTAKVRQWLNEGANSGRA